MTTTEALIGVAGGIGAGVLVGLIYWFIYVKWKNRSSQSKQGRYHRKTYDQTKQNLIIKPESVPTFHVPLFPMRIQEPVVPSYDDTTERLEVPTPNNVRQGRRCSVPLDQLITQGGPVRRKLTPTSPPSLIAINQKAIEDLENKKRKRLFGTSRSSTSPLGKVEFSLYYDRDFQDLQVHIIRGIQVYNLGSVDGLSELVISVAVAFDGKQIWKDNTKQIEACNNPDFNEQLTIHGLTSNQMKLGTLKLTLVNYNTNLPISVVHFPLSIMPFNFLTCQTLSLNEVEELDESRSDGTPKKEDDGCSHGELLICMLHSPSDKKLTVGVECARDLPAVNRGPPDTYVKVEIVSIGSKPHSVKTKVFQKDCYPEYNSIFEFDVDDDKLSHIGVNFKVKHYGKVRDTKIGIVRLGYTADPQEPEYRHWEQVLHHPYMNIEKWHIIGKYH